MFKTVRLTLGLLVLLSPAFAQQPKPKPPKPEKPAKIAPIKDSEATVERLRKLLKLNGDQVFKLRPMVTDRNQQLAQAYEQSRNAQERKAESDAIQRHFENDVRAILTLDQATKFDTEVLRHPGSFR
jgi:hypothetical protein